MQSSPSFTVHWSNPPVDILHVIIHKFNLTDFLQFSATCHFYHSCNQTHRRNCSNCPKTLSPWLLFPSPRTNHHLKVHDFFSQTTHNITNQNSISCVGSSNGFLITTTQPHDLDIINPLTQTRFPLPRNLHTVNAIFYNDHDRFGDDFIFKAVVNVDDTYQRPDMAAVMYVDRVDIAFAKPYGNYWVDFCYGFDRIDDILFHKGRLYAVFKYGTDVFHLDSPQDEPEFIPSPHQKEAALGEEWNSLCKFGKEGTNNLVESPDREYLFVVIRRCKPKSWNNEGRMMKETIGFDVCVLKFTDGQESWDMIDSLGGLAMFVGHSSLCFVPWSNDVKDCIYFIDGLNTGNVGEFDCITRRMEWLSSPVDLYRTSDARAFWFKPSLV